VNAGDFRRIALGLDGAIESAHMGHPDFRANGRIFATLHPDRRAGMVKLTPEQQRRFVRDDPGSFTPEPGAWGRGGCTAVRLATVDEEMLGEALTLAWQNSAIAKRTTRNVKRKAKNTKPKKRKR
jgi:hypothetical protein